MKQRIILTATLIAALALLVSPAVLSETAPDAVGALTEDAPPVKPSPSIWDETPAPAPKTDAPAIAAAPVTTATPAAKPVNTAGCAKPELVVIDFDRWKATCDLSTGRTRIHELRIDVMDKSIDSDVTNGNYDQSGISMSYAMSFRKTDSATDPLAFGIINFLDLGVAIEHGTVYYDNQLIEMLYYSGGGSMVAPYNSSASENTLSLRLGGLTRGGTRILGDGGLSYQIDWGVQYSKLESNMDSHSSFDKTLFGGRAAIQAGWRQNLIDVFVVQAHLRYERVENGWRDSDERRDYSSSTLILDTIKMSETYTIGVSAKEVNITNLTVELFVKFGTIYSSGTVDEARGFSGYGAGVTMEL